MQSTDRLLRSILCVEKLENINLPDEKMTFISLDVKQLYSSIPLQHGITTVMNFISQYWMNISNYGFTLKDVEDFLKFVIYNYEINYNNKTYLQINGCPMGSHFAPAFAILYMNFIEKTALDILRNKHKISPLVFYRYIDDIIIGPFNKSTTNFEVILDVFNSVNSAIQFTVEIPDNGILNFLDLSIAVCNRKVQYRWYCKEQHSNITLSHGSWVPSHVKSNFIRSSFKNIKDRCSDNDMYHECSKTLINRLQNNGYTSVEKYASYDSRNRKDQRNDMLASLNIDFISDSCTRKLRSIARKYDVPVRITCKPGKSIGNFMNTDTFRNNSDCNCSICDVLSDKYSCKSRYVVYSFKCKICNDSYVGSTNRTFSARYAEHERSIRYGDMKSALSQHIRSKHNNVAMTIKDFYVEIIDHQNNPVRTRISEANFIDFLKPTLNRKHEQH